MIKILFFINAFESRNDNKSLFWIDISLGLAAWAFILQVLAFIANQ